MDFPMSNFNFESFIYFFNLSWRQTVWLLIYLEYHKDGSILINAFYVFIVKNVQFTLYLCLYISLLY